MPSECGTVIEKIADKLNYKSAINFEAGQANSFISRKRLVNVKFQCEFEVDITVSLGDGISTSLIHLETELELKEGS